MTSTIKILWVIAFCLLGSTHAVTAATLRPETLKAWDGYLNSVETRGNDRLQAPGKFLWLDDDPRRPARLRNGEIEVLPLRNHGFDHVPNGLIHDWIGAIFVPEASLSQVIGLLTDYDRYDTIYHPEVVDAKLLSHSTDKDEFSMRLANKVLFVSTGIDVRCIGRTVRINDHRAYSLSYTTRVEEIENYGRSDERELAPDTGDGLIWRLYTVLRYQERDGGVYLEMETVALTRDIPSSLSFLITPLVKKLSHNSLTLSLQKTRDAISPHVDTTTRASAGAGLESRGLFSNTNAAPAISSFRQR